MALPVFDPIRSDPTRPRRGSMLLLTFQADESLYAVDVTRVVEVVPRVNLRRLPHAPDFLAGVFDYRGIVVPVIDLGTLLGSAACRSLLSTRIVLVDSRPDERASIGARPWLLGIIAERVSDVVSVKPEGVISAAMQLPTAPYLGSIVELGHEMAQLIVIDRVLDEPLRAAFFGDEEGAGSGEGDSSSANRGLDGEAEMEVRPA
jgi:chemotaxis-related protein WspB